MFLKSNETALNGMQSGNFTSLNGSGRRNCVDVKHCRLYVNQCVDACDNKCRRTA